MQSSFPPSVSEDLSIHNLLLDQLDGYLKRMLHPSNTLWNGAVIIGKTGAGKTFLIEKYLQNSSFDVLISSQSPQLQHVPYAGLKLAIGNYLRTKFREMDPDTFVSFSEGLSLALGENFALMCEYIPELTMLVPKGGKQEISNTPKMENQLYYLFKVFFEYFSDFSDRVLILFTDDLQWIDGSSANLLQYLLTHIPPSKLLWLGAVRDSEEDLGQVDQLIGSLGFDQKHIQRIELGEFTLDQSRLFIEQLLGGKCELTASQLVHQLGKGNPALLSTLVDALVQEKLLVKDKEGWRGNVTEIKARFQGVNSTQFYQERLNSLSDSAKKIVGLNACAEQLSENDLEHLCSNIPDAKSVLAHLISDGILVVNHGKYVFSESYFREFIYSRLTNNQKSSYHFQLAKVLLRDNFSLLSNSDKVIIAQHLQFGTDSISQTGEKVHAATILLEVAKLQKDENAYSQAKIFLKASLELLKGLRWDEVNEILFQAHIESAKIEYLLGEYDLAEIKLDFLIEHLSIQKHRAEAFELKIVINNHLGRYRKAVVILQEILGELGIDIPSNDQELTKQIQVFQKHVSLQSSKIDALFEQEEDERQSSILRLLYIGGMAMHHTSEALMTWAALQLILRSRYFKLPNVSTIGYVSYGRMRIIAGDLTGGYEFGKMGLDINTALEDLQYRCRVLGVFAFYIQPWKRAFDESTILLQEGMEVGRKSGDLIGLYILKTHLFNLHFISGKPISGLLSFDFRESYPGMELTYYITHYQKELIRYLTTESPFLSLPKQHPGGLAAKLTLQEERFYRNYVLARYFFLFGYYDQAKACAEEANQNKKLQEASPLVPANILILSFSITQNWGNLKEEEKRENLAWLKGVFRDLNAWYNHAPANYASDYWLLKAEIGRISGANELQVEQDYKQACQFAGSNLYQAALSNELTGKYYLAKKDYDSAKLYFLESVNNYELWEAKRKVRQLVRQYSFLFDSSIRENNPLDIENILRELGGEMDAELISKKLLTILLRISASSGAAIQLIEEKGQFGQKGEMQLLNKPLRNREIFGAIDLSGIFLMSYRTKSPLIFDELEIDNGFPQLRLLNEAGIKSCMIFPVGISDSLSMIIYLESSFCSANYSNEIIRWVRILASQGGIILENARIYERSLLLNQEIKLEVEQKQDLMTLIEKQKNVHIKDLLKVQEYERERIAGELHDSLGSQLSTIKIRLANMFDKYEENHLLQEGKETLDKLDAAIGEVRKIAHHMSPVSLRRFGLPSALQSLIEDINESTPIIAELQVLGFERRLEDQIELTVYRICQELIQNVLKHASAKHLRVQLINHEDTLNITVEDDGIGIQKERKDWGMGLVGIEAKVQMLKGSFTIENQPNHGCLLVIDLPVNT
ncbi:AAA family ATPase [Algoriphagus winogradskyi]|uniref:Predicted ATPase n=1 Tax=Algoriphagus winogradskyi TaxID=237017 RepID=A0ABY1P2X5_9BACT|nr:AAA family ATPase [Algoriphagus winogradskyi]SMP25205.1 Predicted ATPase [Algoriphagus winogradskyi]